MRTVHNRFRAALGACELARTGIFVALTVLSCQSAGAARHASAAAGLGDSDGEPFEDGRVCQAECRYEHRCKDVPDPGPCILRCEKKTRPHYPPVHTSAFVAAKVRCLDTTECERGVTRTDVPSEFVKCIFGIVAEGPENASMRECHQLLEVHKSDPAPVSETSIDRTCRLNFAGLTDDADAKTAACLHESGLTRECDPNR